MSLIHYDPRFRRAYGQITHLRYDLKTATRLYVLETHHSQVSAISFSPDGRRLVTAALDDRKLTVWKVGSSFGSMFVVGGPPRQGTGPGEPFKTYDFFVTDEDSKWRVRR